MLRILMAPIFVFLLLAYPEQATWQRFLALFLFVLAISTDGIDGMIARRTDKVTDLGKFLDPVADKVLIGGALVALSILGEIDWWVTAVILLRELAVTVYRALVAKKVVLPASLAGKLKTILQGVAIGVVLAPFEVWFPVWSLFELFTIYVAVAATVISGVSFFVAVRKK
ncbi:MAG: CDP-diacylglycerol--glycerol-3-phosphate 3-phosphatidyltransferase [Actinobacteria bacterium]|nr:CDP-diacylglycerol--glycerol-3-phosphate 3-phosphatidyltransferase [Actinomycetota bacterium]